MRHSLVLVLLASCASETARPAQPTPIQSVSVAPQSTTSPNDPVLLVGPQKPLEAAAPGDIERVPVKAEEPDARWKPPKEVCPNGIGEMMSVHLKIGETMELPAGARPVSALGSNPDAIEVVFDRGRKIVRLTARKYGLVFVLTARDNECIWYGVSGGY